MHVIKIPTSAKNTYLSFLICLSSEKASASSNLFPQRWQPGATAEGELPTRGL
jgi:hypothetical protein